MIRNNNNPMYLFYFIPVLIRGWHWSLSTFFYFSYPHNLTVNKLSKDLLDTSHTQYICLRFKFQWHLLKVLRNWKYFYMYCSHCSFGLRGFVLLSNYISMLPLPTLGNDLTYPLNYIVSDLTENICRIYYNLNS